MTLLRQFLFSASLLLLLLTTGCVNLMSSNTTSSLSFPSTSKVFVTFQEEKVPAQCKAYSHLLVTTIPNVTGKQIQQEIVTNAKQQGADMLLIGIARENFDEDLEEFVFSNYGPKKAYAFQKRWAGWKYGFKDWNHGGEIVSFGFRAWDEDETPFNSGLIVQAVYLTCQFGPQRPTQN